MSLETWRICAIIAIIKLRKNGYLDLGCPLATRRFAIVDTSEGREVVPMISLSDVLTLLLVVFAALNYIDSRNKKE